MIKILPIFRLVSAICLLIAGELAFSQTVYTFTNCGATGYLGPTQTQVNAAYGSTNLSGQVTVTSTGIQNWTVPASGKYSIEVVGAKGGGPNGGKGARMIGEFNLTGGTPLKILVGQQGNFIDNTTRREYSGGGGSYVTDGSNNILVIAGGGGGAHITNISGDASTGSAGNNGGGGHSNANGGSGGGGGSHNNQTSDGGAGYSGNGSSGNPSPAPQSFLNGGQGGCNSWGSATCIQGGFGGGGGVNRNSTTWWACGGGGGYSGGGSAYGQLSNLPYAGGGGSLNNGTNQQNSVGYGVGDGEVIITRFPTSDNDAGVTQLISPTNNCVGTYAITAQISNLGTNQITSVQVNWTLNGVPQTPYTHTSLLDTAGGTGPNTANISLGSITLAAGPPYDFKIWTLMPNNVNDTINSNDTLTASITGYAYPTVNLGPDVSICPEDSITFNGGTGHDSLVWSTNDKTQTIKVNATGLYYVSVFENGCESRDSIVLSHYTSPAIPSFGPDTQLCFNETLLLDATTAGVTYLWQDNSTNPTFTVDTNGVYTVVVEDGNGCEATESINVTYFLDPSVQIFVSPGNDICFGASYTFTAFPFTQGSIRYQWRVNGNPVGSPTTDPTFKGPVNYGDSVSVDLLTDVCSTSEYPVPSNKIEMKLNPAPKFITGKDTVIENTIQTYVVPLVVSSAYVWRAVGGSIVNDSTNNTVSVSWGGPNPNAKLILEETDSKNCIRENELDVAVVSIVGVDQFSKVSIGEAYPNPADNSVTIPVYSKKEQNVNISIYDVSGKEVSSLINQRINGSNNLTIDVTKLEEGLYFFRITSSDGSQVVKKLTIQH